MNTDFLFKSFPEGILMLDTDGNIEYANPSITNLTGYTMDELLGKPLTVLYENPDDDIKTTYELNMTRKNGRYVSEGWKYKKDHTHFWAEMNLSLIRDEQGDFHGFSCMLSDRSEKNKELQQLIKSEERYRIMVEEVKDYSIFSLDTKGYIATWNEGAKIMKGYQTHEIIGKHFSIFYILEDLESKKPERELAIAIQTGKYEEEGWRVKKNGSLFWANVVITALFDSKNEHIGFSKVTRDLTGRRLNDEFLRQSEERYRLLVEQVTDYAIFMMNDRGQIISWNEGAKRIKGYKTEEIIGKYFSIFYPKEDLLSNKPARELQIARKEGKYEEEGWRIRKDGSRFWANIVITTVYNSEGALIGFSKVTKDLTERKSFEKQLKDSSERYRLLSLELKQRNAELLEANLELEQFTSIASHDLQEPLRSIQSFLQLIELKLRDGQNEDLEKYIVKSILAAGRMRELILNLLKYAQITKEEPVSEDISADELFNDVLQNVKASIETTNAKLIVTNEAENIQGNKIQLTQLLQNLISNALKFNDKKQPQISVACKTAGNEVIFSVADNGIGMDKEDTDKIFEIFKRLNSTSVYAGTGIGLSICKRIVERHHGRIWVESKPGYGSIFYFSIPEKKDLHEKV